MHRAFGIVVVAILGVAQIASAAEDFVWTYGGRLIGHLAVPKGFHAETYNYREGIVTTLRYDDGSFIMLQSGGMYRIPLFQDKEHILISSKDQDAKTIRIGRFADTNLCWREDDYKRGKPGGGAIGIVGLFPPNVGYGKVPPSRRGEFDQSLDSFAQEVGTPIINH
jgi:hypothetical protein